MDGKDGEKPRDEYAADRADDRACGLDVAPVNNELCRKRDDGADEDRPEEDLRKG